MLVNDNPQVRAYLLADGEQILVDVALERGIGVSVMELALRGPGLTCA